MQYFLPPVFRGESAEYLPLAGEVNWGMEVLGVNHLRSIVKSKIKVGVVDTGIDKNHPLLNHCAGSKSFVPGESDYDGNGHGVHVSGTVAASDPRIGVATGFPFYHGKGLSNGGSGGSGLLNAMEWCVEQGCKVVSNSWGGGGQDMDWERRFEAMNNHPSRPWLIFAGGNSGPNTPDTDWPGRSRHLINVAALNQDLTPASFSSAGDKIDTSGPGVNIWSCKPGGGFQQMSGTSMSTPWVAGLLALYRAGLEERGMYIPTIYELREQLFNRSTDVHTPGDDRRTGPGALMAVILANALTVDPPKYVP